MTGAFGNFQGPRPDYAHSYPTHRWVGLRNVHEQHAYLLSVNKVMILSKLLLALLMLASFIAFDCQRVVT